jgi:hypothetical protein
VLAGPVDVFIKKFWEHGQPLFALSPSCVNGGTLSAASTIKHRDKGATDARLRAARTLTKLEDLIRRARFNRSYEMTGRVKEAAKPALADLETSPD